MSKKVYTLTEISWVLKQPQHRLIYLCEKGVIIPDNSDAKGRGSSRRFSPRNVFEYSVALALSEFHVPAVLSKKIIYTLRSFQELVSQSIPEFNLPFSLDDKHAPRINLILSNGSLLYFTLGNYGKPRKIIGPVNLDETDQVTHLPMTDIESIKTKNSLDLFDWIPESSSPGFLLLDLNRIAKALKLE